MYMRYECTSSVEMECQIHNNKRLDNIFTYK